MTAPSTLRAAELAAIIARRSTLPPLAIAAHVTHLQRIARQAVTLATNLCNVPDYQPTFDRREKKLAELATALCVEFGGDGRFQVMLGGDPRGPCLRLLIEGERGDGWDQASDGTGSFAVY